MLETLESARLFAGNTADGTHVYIEIELRKGQRPGGQGQTVFHEPTPDSYLDVSFTYEEVDPRQPGDRGIISLGAGVEDALGRIDTPAPDWTQADIDRLAELADTWHLNGMNGACAHMKTASSGPTGWGFDIGAMDSPNPKPTARNPDPRPTLSHYTVNKALECPITGYRYGSAWLVKVVPDDVLAEIRDFMQRPNSDAHTDLVTIEVWCDAHGFEADVEYADSNPNMPDDRAADHYEVTLRFDGKQMVVPFSQGVAVEGEPDAARVLSCLLSDAAMIDDVTDYEEFARMTGYDEDSRKADRIFTAIQQQTKKLRKLLGDAMYTDLLENVERD